jgi:catechol 2,3-dioxygenase-like lactoylglutathione lyase family enzyme
LPLYRLIGRHGIVGEIFGLDHVQLAMPAGQEALARAFYGGVLGLSEELKPPHLAARGGVWFRQGELRLHLGVDADFRAAKKAHPAFLVRGLAEVAARCEAAGFPPVTDEPLEGFNRVYVSDPFGNRIELLEPIVGTADHR